MAAVRASESLICAEAGMITSLAQFDAIDWITETDRRFFERYRTAATESVARPPAKPPTLECQRSCLRAVAP